MASHFLRQAVIHIKNPSVDISINCLILTTSKSWTMRSRILKSCGWTSPPNSRRPSFPPFPHPYDHDCFFFRKEIEISVRGKSGFGPFFRWDRCGNLQACSAFGFSVSSCSSSWEFASWLDRIRQGFNIGFLPVRSAVKAGS